MQPFKYMTCFVACIMYDGTCMQAIPDNTGALNA